MKGQSKTDNPEKLATKNTQYEEMCKFPKFESFYFSANFNVIFVKCLY